ncbi:hypothetical protein R1flu_004103 [Riccia fluitans]|uniref:Methyltransferase n=1 Tax=Riccia fluitans TaxID=41844 RepID=A0ABD1YQB1_9MARC
MSHFPRLSKMKDKELKNSLFGPEKRQKYLPLFLIVSSLCAVSFYLGAAYGSEKQSIEEAYDSLGAGNKAGCTSVIKQGPIPPCNISMQDYTPCTDPIRWRKFDKQRMAFRERHCPPRAEKLQCLIPPPEGYKSTMLWPKSRKECWYKNVPYDWINNEKANQNWLKKKDDKFIFPGGGTMFPNGVGEYIDHMEELIPGMKDGSIRTALDTGCGVASWGGDLLDRKILAMSLAPRDNHEAQVQFALERGIPAMLGIIATQRMPYPANAFDIAHCSRCLIPWTEFGGVYLLEVDRVLRPGGFWVLSGPPVNYGVHWMGWESTEEKQKRDLDNIKDLLSKMCYKEYAAKDDLAVWQKPLNNDCYEQREEATYPPICDDAIEADAAWYVPMRPCIVPQNPDAKRISVDTVPKWPERLNHAPERLKWTAGGNTGGFNQDTRIWKVRVKHYKTLVPELGSNKIRNVMDMNTLYGSFAAALIDDPVWVMNVVSSYATNSLGVVYDRGLTGTVSDWCEAFSTYPRTYDMLHVAGLFTAESHRCEMKDVMLEMDRILRPNGITIIRDTPQFLNNANVLGKAMRWKCTRHETEMGPDDTEGILVCKKKFWTVIEESDES